MHVETLPEELTNPAGALAPDSAEENTVIHISLIEVATELAWRKRLIGKTVLAAMAIGCLLCLVWPVRYTATTRIMTPQQTPSVASMLMNQLAGNSSGALAAMAGEGLSLKNPNDIYVGMLKSRPVADSIIRRFSLTAEYHSKDMTAAREKLAGRTEVVSEKDGFIAISVTDGQRNRAAAMANAYTEELRSLTRTLALTEASQRRVFYEDQLSEAKTALISAELGFQQIEQKRGLVQPDAQATAMIAGLAELQAQVAAKQVELQALRSYSTERNPDVQLAERELSSLQGEALRLEQRSRSSGFADLGLQDIPSAGMDYLRAEHELQYRQAIYDLLMKQYDAARLDEAKEAAVIQVVETAAPPDRRSSPRYLLTLLLSAVAGVICGGFLALLSCWKELIDADPFRSQQVRELKQALLGRTGSQAMKIRKANPDL